MAIQGHTNQPTKGYFTQILLELSKVPLNKQIIDQKVYRVNQKKFDGCIFADFGNTGNTGSHDDWRKNSQNRPMPLITLSFDSPCISKVKLLNIKYVMI